MFNQDLHLMRYVLLSQERYLLNQWSDNICCLNIKEYYKFDESQITVCTDEGNQRLLCLLLHVLEPGQ